MSIIGGTSSYIAHMEFKALMTGRNEPTIGNEDQNDLGGQPAMEILSGIFVSLRATYYSGLPIEEYRGPDGRAREGKR